MISASTVPMIPASTVGWSISLALPTDAEPPVDSRPHPSLLRAGESKPASTESAAAGDGSSSGPEAEREFMEAIQAYKQSSGRMFPTWSEILEVIKSLGYEKSAQGRD